MSGSKDDFIPDKLHSVVGGSEDSLPVMAGLVPAMTLRRVAQILICHARACRGTDSLPVMRGLDPRIHVFLLHQ